LLLKYLLAAFQAGDLTLGIQIKALMVTGEDLKGYKDYQLVTEEITVNKR
jgi:hypothetical protein